MQHSLNDIVGLMKVCYFFQYSTVKFVLNKTRQSSLFRNFNSTYVHIRIHTHTNSFWLYVIYTIIITIMKFKTKSISPVYASCCLWVTFLQMQVKRFSPSSDHNTSNALISIYTTPLQQNRINEVIPVRMANWRDIF